MLDEMDVKILRILQEDCTRSVADIGKEVGCRPRRAGGASRSWRRRASSSAASPSSMRRASTPASPCSCRSRRTSTRWPGSSGSTGRWSDFPEVVEFYRMSGEVDYLLRVVVPDIAAYDAFYKKLIARIEISKVSSAFAMEQIKYTTALPLDFALRRRRKPGGRAPQRLTILAYCIEEDMSMTEPATTSGCPRSAHEGDERARVPALDRRRPPAAARRSRRRWASPSPRWRRASCSSR